VLHGICFCCRQDAASNASFTEDADGPCSPTDFDPWNLIDLRNQLTLPLVVNFSCDPEFSEDDSTDADMPTLIAAAPVCSLPSCAGASLCDLCEQAPCCCISATAAGNDLDDESGEYSPAGWQSDEQLFSATAAGNDLGSYEDGVFSPAGWQSDEQLCSLTAAIHGCSYESIWQDGVAHGVFEDKSSSFLRRADLYRAGRCSSKSLLAAARLIELLGAPLATASGNDNDDTRTSGQFSV